MMVRNWAARQCMRSKVKYQSLQKAQCQPLQKVSKKSKVQYQYH